MLGFGLSIPEIAVQGQQLSRGIPLNYVPENGTDQYVTEDGANNYTTEG